MKGLDAMSDDLHIPTYAQLNAMTSTTLDVEIGQVNAWIAHGATAHNDLPRQWEGERALVSEKLYKLRERRDVLVGHRLKLQALTKPVRAAMGEPRRDRSCNMIGGHNFDFDTNICIHCGASPSM